MNTYYEYTIRDFYEWVLLKIRERTTIVEKGKLSYRLEVPWLLKDVCTYAVYAKPWGRTGMYTGGFV